MNKKSFEEWLWDEQKKIQKEADALTGSGTAHDIQVAFRSGRLHEVFEVRKHLEELK